MGHAGSQASWTLRLVAIIIDGFPIALVVNTIFFGLDLDVVVLPLLLLVAFVLYFGAFWSARAGGQTPGMRIVGIRVASRSGTPLSFRLAVLRALALFFGLAFWVAPLSVLLRADHRSLHDVVVDSQVIRV